MYLIDTNVLIRVLQPDDPNFAAACRAVRCIHEQGYDLALVPQVIAEFWNVCTRPLNRIGLGRDCSETERKLRAIEATYRLYLDTPEIYRHWRRLVAECEVQGVQVHDTRLVAAMLAHGLTHILTFNGKDFKRFQEITVVDPTTIA